MQRKFRILDRLVNPGHELPNEYYKSMPKDALDDLFPDSMFKTPPRMNQKVAFAWALDGRDRCNLWFDVGTGKTLTAMYLAQLWNCRRLFVVCPNSVVMSWYHEIKEHMYTDLNVWDEDGIRPAWLTAILAHKSTPDRHMLFNAYLDEKGSFAHHPQIHVINYEGLVPFFGARKRSNKWAKSLLYDAYPALHKLGFDCLVIDEMHHAKSPDAMQTRILMDISRGMDHVIGLTGTPIDKNPIDIWSQQMIIDGGKALGANFVRHRNEMFQKCGFNWLPKSDTVTKIVEKIQPTVLHYSTEECVDLPDIVYQPRYLVYSDIQKTMINQIRSGNTAAPMTTTESWYAEARVCGGIDPYNDDMWLPETANPKIAALLDVLDSGINRFIVYHFFVEEGRLLEHILDKHGVSYVSARGETDSVRALEEYKNDTSIRILLANPASAGEGFNIQKTVHAICYYSRNWSSLSRKQTVGRIVRSGQTEKCLITDLILSGISDEDAYNCVLAGQEVTVKLMKSFTKNLIA